MTPTVPSESKLAAPVLSLVIPVHNLENYVDECLNSIIEQDFTDIEIIAVDNQSTDRSREILEARAKADRRITVVREQRKGPGNARNTGMRHATGEYIWFVDGDDTIADGSLKAIASRLEHDCPDILFLNYRHILPDGREQTGHDDLVIQQLPESIFTLAEQPRVIDLGLICWNKVISRRFLLRSGLEFLPDSPHEEIPLSCLLLPEATTLSVLRQNCYRYRQSRTGSVMLSGEPRRHFKIFEAFDVVLERTARMVVNRDPALPEQLYCAYFRRAMRHFTSIYDAGAGKPHRDPARYIAYSDRREFFERMHGEYLRFKPTGYRPGYSALDWKLRLIRADAYRRYSLLEPMNRLRNTARRRLTR